MKQKGTENRRKKRAFTQQQDSHLRFWENCGVQVQGIEVRCDDAGLRGCYSTRSLDEQTIVIRVPEKESLIEYRRSPLPVPDNVDKKSWRTVGSFARLAFHLLQRPDASEILSMLPRYPDDVDLPLKWSSASLKELSRLCASADRRVSEERHCWENALKVLKGALSRRGFSDNDYLTALHAIRTRAFDCSKHRFDRWSLITFVIMTLCIWSCWLYAWRMLFKPDFLKFFFLPAMLTQILVSGEWLDWQRQSYYAFIPGLDMLNHSSSGHNAVLGFDDPSSQFLVRCSDCIKEDCELTFQYAAASNDELLFTYGFVEKDNPKDVLEIMLYSLSEICDVSEQVNMLRRYGIDRIRFERNGAVNGIYLKAIGFDSLHYIARQIRQYIEKSIGKSHALLECYKREKLRLLDEFLAKKSR